MTGLRVQPLPGRAGLKVSGEIDVRNRAEWKTSLDDLAAAGQEVHLDLAGLRMVDAGGVAALAAAAQRLAPNGGVVLHAPPPALCRILEVLWPGTAGIEVCGR